MHIAKTLRAGCHQPISTYSLHCSSFLGLPFGILNIELVKPKKRTYNGDYRCCTNRSSQSHHQVPTPDPVTATKSYDVRCQHPGKFLNAQTVTMTRGFHTYLVLLDFGKLQPNISKAYPHYNRKKNAPPD